MRFFKPLVLAAWLALAAASPGRADSILVSSKIDTEGALLGNIIAQTLQAHGRSVTTKISLGSRSIVRKAIAGGESKGQASAFNLTRDIRGAARIVERAFGIGASALLAEMSNSSKSRWSSRPP